MDFGFVHGLNHDGIPRSPLVEAVLRGGGVRVNSVTDIDWGSQGTFSGDVAAFTADVFARMLDRPTFRSEVVKQVYWGMRKLAEEKPTAIVIAHSMGCPLAVMAARIMAASGLIPPRLLFIGSPFGHPIHGQWLRALGFLVTPPEIIEGWHNNSDPIVALADMDPVFPPWLRSTRIALADNEVPDGEWEHACQFYLGHELFLAPLRA